MFKYLWIVILVIAYIIFTIVGLYDLYEEVFEKSCSNCALRWDDRHCSDRTNLTCFKHKHWTDMLDDLQDAYVFKVWLCLTGLSLFIASMIVYLLSLEG